MSVMTWQQCTDDREKYGLYLNSREWAEKRNAVKKRSGGVCERCKHNPSSQVHHLTYNRKYNEPLEDLQDICRPCHEFIHGRREDDPSNRLGIQPGMVVASLFYGIGQIINFDGVRGRVEVEFVDNNRMFSVPFSIERFYLQIISLDRLMDISEKVSQALACLALVPEIDRHTFYTKLLGQQTYISQKIYQLTSDTSTADAG